LTILVLLNIYYYINITSYLYLGRKEKYVISTFTRWDNSRSAISSNGWTILQ